MVNTFLCYNYDTQGFKKTFRILDKQRCNKQLTEAHQIISLLEKEINGIPVKGWINHPCVKQWRGYLMYLQIYFNDGLEVWLQRGGKLGSRKFLELSNVQTEKPWWLNWKPLHYSHMAALKRKNPWYYKDTFPELPKIYESLGYIWPSNVKYETLDNSSPKPEWFAKINPETFRNASKGKQMSFTKKQLQDMILQSRNNYDVFGNKILTTDKIKKLKKEELFEIVFPSEWIRN